MAKDRPLFQERWLIFVAALPIIWAVIRAGVQSITMDEANTYFWFVARSDPWYPFPNNHILNSLLMWLSTNAFGTSSITIRTPALLGGILYTGICYFLCRRIASEVKIQALILVCLTYNPFILDYMVAARGYSLANGFLLMAIAVPVWHHTTSAPSLRQSCVLASLALGLSFTANFSFAFVDLAAFLVITTWAVRQAQERSFLRTVGFCAVPGLLVALLICGYPLAHWNWGDLTWGAQSLKEMRQSLLQSSLYRLNPQFQETGWYKTMDFLRPRLPPLLVILCLCRLVAARLDGSWLRDTRTRWLVRCAAALAAIVTLCVLMHWLAFRIDRLPLPMGRTGIFLVPLTTLLAGCVMAAPACSPLSRWLRRGTVAVFFCLACYFLLCLRLSYFREYQFDADAKDVYSILARYNHTYGVSDVGMTGLCFASMNYYRVMSGKETFPEFKLEPPDPPLGKSIYVITGVDRWSFITKEKLVVVYQGKLSDSVIAVRPDGVIPPTSIEP